ncbi:hypothetical protein [Tenacibaculum sp. UWU-22]|uniref:hypothetical protein n=1 Tax=Tenacibaculum sp. UWU-22 TaxID=3234187 RepID=UPI0034DAC84F
MINIYIGLSKNQISSYERIIEINKSSKNILISNKTLKINTLSWDEVIYANNTFNNQSNNTLSAIKNIILKIKQYKKIIKKLSKYKNCKKVTLYFTYVEDILTNYLLLTFNKNVKGIVVEDGTLNYYSHTIKSLSKKKVFLKWFLSNFYGVRFKFYKGHSSGIELSNVTKQYVRMPKLSLFPEKSEKLPFPSKSVRLTNSALIIGQEGYINQYGEKRYYKSLEEMIDLINFHATKKPFDKIYYKPHRNGKRVNLEWLNKKIQNIIYLESDVSLEDLYFDTLGSKAIYSFDSSALLNIFLELEEKQRNKLTFNILLRYNILLEPVFRKFKFNIYQ